MKHLKATKCKDGYYVEITESFTVGCKDDVYKIARENGLKLTNSYKFIIKNLDEMNENGIIPPMTFE
jgi:hypothetical protein